MARYATTVKPEVHERRGGGGAARHRDLPDPRRGAAFRPHAERLHVSTARVTQTIKKLERRIGAALFERTSRQVALTPIGRRLDADLRPAYQQIREGIDRAVAAGRGIEGVPRVGFIGTAVGQLPHQVGEAFHARHPACQVQIREAATAISSRCFAPTRST